MGTITWNNSQARFVLSRYCQGIVKDSKKGVCPNCSRVFLTLTNWYDKKMECPICSESITDNIIVDENENDDSFKKIVYSALIGLIGMKLKQYTKNQKHKYKDHLVILISFSWIPLASTP